nr:phage tail protein [uncultured Bilophila sp.]
MAETTLQGIWTQKGLDKETAFRAGGERKKLTHVAVGDGNGSLPIVRAAQTSLVHEVWRGLANAVMVNPDDPTDLLVDAVIPNNVGGFWIREWGIFDEDGDLVAVGPHDEMHKPLISTGQAAEFLERFHLPSANATFVEIKIASQALATQQYVEHEVDVHNKDSGAHETLARKNVQIKAGTGLSGGGTLEADRTLVVTYGNAAGTACQGNDVRLSDARTPKAHTSTATTYGAASDTQYGHAKASGTTPKAPGTAAVGTEKDTFARGDHVHPAQTTVSGKAGSATKLDTARTIDGVSFNGSANITHYGTCSTAAATVEKAVPLTGFTLATGAVVRVKFTVTNTAASPTLNVASTGAKPLYYRGAAVAAGTLAANRTYEFVYNGTQYELVGDVDTNTTYTPAAAAPKAAGTAAVGTSSKYAREDHVHPEQTTVSGNAGSATKLATARTIDGVSFNGSANITHYGSCATEAATAAKVVACTGFALATGSRITVRFTVTNTAASPTLNVNGTGAKALRYRNAAISAGYLAANRTYEFVYDGTYYQLVGDIDTNTTYAVATQAKNGLLAAADKKALDYCEAFRLSMIGVPRYWRSTTLPANHVWANGDLVLFADWPELKKVYDAGGFNGMLLAYNANAATIAANLGKWRPNAANPTGLYVPKLGDQFFRACTGAAGAGTYTPAGLPNIEGQYAILFGRDKGGGSGAFYKIGMTEDNLASDSYSIMDYQITIGFDASRSNSVYGKSSKVSPESVNIPMIFYLGVSA